MDLEREAVRKQLARLVASPEFAGVPRLQRFLAFVVETALEGRAADIKETLVAVEVYGRSPDYSPQLDATVRVEAGRLRARLRQYYEGSGSGDPIEIGLPKGTYVPVFAKLSTEAPRVRPFPKFAAAAAAMAVLSIGGVWWLVRSEGRPVHAAKSAPDAETMELYLRARQLLKQPRYSLSMDGPVPASVLQAVRLFEETTRRSPRFAPGWAGLGEANEFAWELDPERPAGRLAAAKAAARRAIEIDPKLPEAWTLLASIHFYREFDLAAAEAACRRAIELNPRDALAHRRFLDLLRIQGRTSEGLSHATAALSRDPLSVTLRVRRAMLLYDSGRFHEAAQESDRAAALNSGKQQPLYSMALWVQGASHQQMGRMDKAETLFRAALDEEPNDTWNGPALAYLLAITGRASEAEQLARGFARRLGEGKILHSKLALVYAGLGRDAEAIRLLEEGFQARDAGVLFARIEKRFERLRPDSRFLAFLDRIEQTYRPRHDLARVLLPAN